MNTPLVPAVTARAGAEEKDMRATEVFWQGQARVFREAAEAWKEEHDLAGALLDFEDSLAHVLAAHEGFGASVRRVWEALFSDTLPRPLEAGRSMQKTCGLLAEAVED